MTRREITKIIVQYYKLTGISPCIKHAVHLPFSKKRAMTLFGTWNNMLEVAGVPLNRNKIKKMKCPVCKVEFERQVKEIRKSKKSFCSSACSAHFNTKGRKHSEETKKKISEALKAHKIFK